MAGTSYTRQSTLTDGDTITSALFNAEYNQLVTAFSYAATGTTGHQHDGGAGEGGNIEIIGDQDFLNKIVVDSTNNRWSVFVQVGGSAVEQVRIEDGVVYPVTDSDVDLGTNALRFKNAYIDSLTATGNLTVGGNITVTGNVDVDGIVEFDGLSGTGAVTVTDILDQDDMSGDSATALATQQSIKAYVDAQQDTVDTFGEVLALSNTTAGTDISVSTDDKVQFRDSAIYINSSADGQLDIVADTEIQIAATTIDINGAVALNGAVTGATNITLSGELDAATGDFSGAVDIDGALDVAGTTNLDVVDIDGAVDMATTLAVAGNVDFNGDLDVDGVTNLDVVDIDGAVNMATTLLVTGNVDFNGDLDVDGTTNLDVVDIDGAVDMASTLAVAGVLTAASLDISGDVDVDGTLETDALTIAGVTLSETISDTVGAMVASNTETGIAVTYDDADNTLDFVIGDNAIVQSMIADDSIDSQMYVDGSIDLVHMSANSVDSDQYVDGSIDTAHIADSQITSAKIADGTIATGDIADDAVTGAKLADNIDVAGTLDVTGLLTADANVVVAGNLTVNGTTTTLNTATLDVEDKNITINYGAGDTTGSANGAGITIQDAVDASNDATILWDTTNDEFDFSHPINVAGKVTSTGTSVFASLDISGDIDVDGTTNLDVVDIDGAVDMASTLAVAGVVTANAGVVVDNFTLDGTTLALSSGDFTVDVAGDIILDADGADIKLKDGGTEFARFSNTGTAFQIYSPASDKDITFVGNDGGSTITALTLDMSAAGAATFNSNVALGDSKQLQLGADADMIIYHDGTTNYVQAAKQDSDIILRGNDGGTGINALQLDMSNAGRAYFPSGGGMSVEGSTVFNDASADVDFRVESDVNANSILVNGETGGISFTTSVTNMSSNFNNVAGLGIANNGKVEMATTSNVTALEVSKNEGTDGAVLYLRKQSTGFATHNVLSGNYLFGNPTSDKDVIITGNDGGSAINALTLDMSEAGAATFNGVVTIPVGSVGAPSLTFAGDSDTGIFRRLANTIDITTGGTLRLEIDSAGNFIVQNAFYAEGGAVFNENSYDVDFRVESNSNANAIFMNGATSTVSFGSDNPQTAYSFIGAGGIYIGNGNQPAGDFMSIDAEGGSGGTQMTFYRYDSSINNYQNRFTIGGELAETVANESGLDHDFRVETNDDANALFVNGLTNTVNVGSAYGGNSKFTVNQSASEITCYLQNTLATVANSTPSIIYLQTPNDAAIQDGFKMVTFADQDTVLGSISTAATSTNVAYNTSSDERLKENIVDAGSQLDTLLAVKVREYDWKKNGFHSTGFIAQELHEHIPEAVSVGLEDPTQHPWSVDYGRLTPFIIKAMQEQQTLIESLTARIAALEE